MGEIQKTQNITEKLEELDKTDDLNYKQSYLRVYNAMTDMIKWMMREQIISESICIGDAIKPEDMLLEAHDKIISKS